jgi:hypothetical protein
MNCFQHVVYKLLLLHHGGLSPPSNTHSLTTAEGSKTVPWTVGSRQVTLYWG